MARKIEADQLIDQLPDDYLDGALEGSQHGYDALLRHKQIYDDILREACFEAVRFVAFIYDRATPLLNASAFAPEYDFDGNILQDLGDLRYIEDLIAYCIWSVKGCGVALLVWHRSSDRTCVPFIRSLLRQSRRRLSARLTSLAFEHSENLVFSPEWWEALSRANQTILVERMRGGLGSSKERSAHYLHDDGHTAISARVSEILTVPSLA